MSPSRPRITISVISSDSALDGDILNFDLAPSLTLADLKGFVQAETNIQPDSQHFYLNNAPVQGDAKTLEEAGLKDGDMLAMLARQPAPQPQQQTQANRPRQQQQQQGQYADEQEIERTRLQILGNPSAVAQVREQRPALYEAINDSKRFKEVWMEMMRETHDREQERLEQMRILNEDPFNVDAQRKIEEMIRQETVQDNLQYAYENNPEGKSITCLSPKAYY